MIEVHSPKVLTVCAVTKDLAEFAQNKLTMPMLVLTGEKASGNFLIEQARLVQNKVIVRKNYAEYPPTSGRRALRHDDLIVIYLDRASNQILANYFDAKVSRSAMR